jgi:hypothetical protein
MVMSEVHLAAPSLLQISLGILRKTNSESSLGSMAKLLVSGSVSFSELFFSSVFLMKYLLDTGADGRPRGIAHLDFADQESAVACVKSAAQEPIHLGGRDLRLDFAIGLNAMKSNVEPNRKLYFTGFSGSEAELRTIFKAYGESVSDVHLCMLFTLSDSVPTHME